ncbi:MAG: hypothetical protein JO307_04675 [Bryobacterales bacterium]|nr:hypothetical protein [Bryobacterales bacterium]
MAPPQARATWYTLAAASLWATFAIVPAVGVYRYSWHHALDKLSGFETRQQQARAEDWNARDRWLYKEKNIEVAADDAHKGENENRFYVYRRKQMMQFGVDYSGASSGLEQTWLEDWLDRNLPFYDEPVESFRFQLPSSGEGPIRASDQSGAWFFSWLSAITCLAAAAAAYAWLRIHIQRLFWMSISCPETAEETETQHCLLVLAQSAAEKRCLRGLLERPRAVAASTAAGAGGASSFVSCKDLVIDFEASFEKDDDQRREDLEALEEALQQPDRWVVVLAQSDPLSLLEREGSAAPSTDQEQQQRWAAALKRLTASASLSSPRSLAMPASEVLWRQLSREEQLILIQVAEEGFANPRNELAMQQLLRKGILRFDPGLEVTNERIERFAHERARTEEVKEWERPARSIGWRGTRWIFPVLMVLGLAFATSTGQTWLKSATGVLTVLATGLEALWKVLGAVQKPRSSTG